MEKVIVISGGSDGLGKAIAEKLVHNHKIVILSPNSEKLKTVSEHIGCDYEVCDVTNFDNISESIKSIIKKHKRIDCLINNAGLMVEGKLVDNDFDRIKQVIEVNTLGTIYLTKGILPQMISQSEGLIINVISQGGVKARAERSVYNASKWAITGFTKSLQLEVAEHNIRLTAFLPGKFKSDMFKKIGKDVSMEDALDIEEVVRAVEYIVDTNNDVLIPEFGVIDINRK